MLHMKYYQDYGLAIEGLVRHHKVDALEYNRKVDDALPLDGLITPDPQLRKLLEDLDRDKVKPWLFTNAHITHGQRVVRLLGIEDMFEGITYCDYTKPSIICKPHSAMFDKAQAEAGVSCPEDCYFVGTPPLNLLSFEKFTHITSLSDDSYLNCKQAQARGWTAVHLLQPDEQAPHTAASKYQIRSLEELRTVFAAFFGSTSDDHRGHETS